MGVMNNLLTIFATMLLLFPDTPLGKLADRLAQVGKMIPQEKVYVHMDNSSYMIGDSIWFSAYLRRTNDDHLSDISGILYVELINHDGYVMKRKLVETKYGMGHGAFYLDPEYYPGYYELRAYTRWQLNWGLIEHEHSTECKDWFMDKKLEKRYFRDYDKLYSRVFPVYDAPKRAGAYDENMTLRVMRRNFKKDPDKTTLQLKLYPEGGELIEGVPCRVAFEASYSDGKIAEGRLTMGEESEPDYLSAEAVNRGRGLFSFVPSKQSERTVTFVAKNGDKVKAKLPKAESDGVALQVVHEENQWRMRVQKAGAVKNVALGLTVMHEARISHFEVLNDPIHELVLADSLLECGVNQVTVFDDEGRVLADRLMFVSRPNLCKPSIWIRGLKESYKPYERVTIGVEMTPEARSLAGDTKGRMSGVVSLSVRDKNRASHLYDDANIQTEMLLASEIKGFIPSPNWFFETDDALHREALDLLMMTQGWRRYNWRQMAVAGEWTLSQPYEKTPVVVGEVYNYWPFCFYHPKDWTDLADEVDSLESKRLSLTMGWDGLAPGVYVWFEKERDKNHQIKKPVHIHAELVLPTDTVGSVSDIVSADGSFRLNLPMMYDDSFFFLTPYDSAKLERHKGKYTWIQKMPDMQQKRKFRAQDGELSLRIDQPYPRFVKPYSFYQSNTNFMDEKLENGRILSDGTHQLAEVSVGARRGTLSQLVDSFPAFSVDAYEAYNFALDAGMLSAFPQFIARAYMGDYGLENPYRFVYDSSSQTQVKTYQIYPRYGANMTHRMLNGETVDTDSARMRSNLSVDRRIDTTRTTQDFYGNLAYIDQYVVYTDYCPRLAGSKRYSGSNLPETNIVIVPYPNNDKRPFFRDRRFRLPGIDIPDEFYHVDYSQRAIPDSPTDYRRTLYWNPMLILDSSGKAKVEFYNNSRETFVEATTDGVTLSGQLLTGKR